MPGVAASENQKLSEMEAQLAAARAELAATVTQLQQTVQKLARVSGERDVLRKAYHQAKEQLDLLRRRIYLAKAERIDSSQLELEFAETHRRLEDLATALEEAAEETSSTDAEVGNRPAARSPKGRGKKSAGRRDLRDLDLPEARVEILDPALEGKAERIGWEESCQGGYQRSGPIRVVIARAKYRTAAVEGATATLATAPLPRALLSRSLLAPSLIAHIIAMKFRFGMPYFRQEQMLASEGLPLDRGTMARVVEDIGASLGAVVQACAQDARRTACCLATDATGVAIQPERLADGGRQPCKKGHFFVVLADRKHVFFEYQSKHTSAAVCEMFRGFSGFIQADAHAIYDALFRGEAVDDPEDAPLEVGCWSHTRRRFWEAAIAGYPMGREGLLRIRQIYQHEEAWAELSPAARTQKRQAVLKPLVDDFLSWVAQQHAQVGKERGLVAKALGYAFRQDGALRRFLDDGQLRIDNNASERALRIVATGRKAWLFFGSDDHAQAAANLFSLIASCQLHGLEPELYLAELIHVMPYWPRERYLELAPAYWTWTRARLVPSEIARQVGDITVPPLASPPDATQQSTTN